MGYSAGYYAQLERGVPRHPTEDYLRRLAEVMRLTNDQFVALCQFALARRPGRPLYPEEGMSIWDEWAAIVEEMPGIAYIQDRAFNVIVGSPAWRDMFPHEPPQNTMAWMLFAPEARTYTLIDWEAWALPIIATVVSKWADHPADETLTAIYQEILRDPMTRSLLQRALRQARPHPAGARHRMRHARLGEGVLTVYTAELAGSPGAWLVACRFYPDGEPVPPPGRISSPFGPRGGAA
jgi:transcriptional regulator with XRE-family HTH domain